MKWCITKAMMKKIFYTNVSKPFLTGLIKTEIMNLFKNWFKQRSISRLIYKKMNPNLNGKEPKMTITLSLYTKISTGLVCKCFCLPWIVWNNYFLMLCYSIQCFRSYILLIKAKMPKSKIWWLKDLNKPNIMDWSFLTLELSNKKNRPILFQQHMSKMKKLSQPLLPLYQ